MPLIQIRVGIPPCQIDDFPSEVMEGKEELRKRHREERDNVKSGSEAEQRARHMEERAGLEAKARPFERSCKGALHFRPASTKTVTEDELKFLLSARQHKALAGKILRVEVVKKPPPKPRPRFPVSLPPEEEQDD